MKHYRERFATLGLYENCMFAGVGDLLELLLAQNRTLYIATSKPAVFAVEIARHFDFARHFQRIYGSELDSTRTDKVELIGYLFERENLEVASTLMTGDRKHDLIGARRNGLDAAAVGYGFGSHAELQARRRPITSRPWPSCIKPSGAESRPAPAHAAGFSRCSGR